MEQRSRNNKQAAHFSLEDLLSIAQVLPMFAVHYIKAVSRLTAGKV